MVIFLFDLILEEEISGMTLYLLNVYMLKRLQDNGRRTTPVDIVNTQFASHAFTTHLQLHLPSYKKFKFIYTSSILSVKDRSAFLFFNTAGRLSRGAPATAILEFAAENESV